ncbi:MAG: hypothetical protein M3O62_04905 [Pseudomonadota bacterium]|nr:hypothetical protein [Pseudomonadota bacterium]
MNGRWSRKLTIGTLVCSLCSPAAADLGERRLSFAGFGTLAALYHDEDGVEYRRSVSQPSGAESGKLDFDTDSLAGLQVNAAWNREVELVVQGVTRLTPENDWQPELTRAFLRYDYAGMAELRAGRIGLEIYPRADSRDIGYSQLTIRPAVEIFGIVPTAYFDGAELGLTHPVGDGLASLKLYGGAASGKVVSADRSANDLDGARIWGGHVQYLHGPWILRLGAGNYRLDEVVSLDGLADGLRQTGQPQALALAAAFDRNGRDILFTVAGAAYSEGPLQVQLFAGTVDGEAATSPDLRVGLLTGGYRIDTLTPYAMLAFVDNADRIRGTGLPDTPEFAALNAGALAVQAAGQSNQRSAALGLRYDFAPKLALKLQLDHIWVRDSNLIFDRNPPPQENFEMTVLGVALDFIF